ncbi:two-component sensor histidine kinase [Virgisporangium aurantiacum]|uniref:histidine kinase n=1 Tax=Virgisporangium aurantiacum TaxID=175570 RepID=A0A8J4E0X4_9ACTN|nr:two-component sensor histidine kinase [Virgisporangium aurantiacum]
MRGSVRVRMTGVAVAVVGVTLLVGAVALVLSLNAALVREVRAAAMVRAADAVRVVAAGGDPSAAAAGDDDVVLQVLGPSGAVLDATPNVAGEPALVRLAPGRSRRIDVTFDDDDFLVVAAAAADGRTVLVGHSLDTVVESTRTLAVLLAVGLPVLLLVVGATAWRVVGWALAPVDAIRVEADTITGTQLHRRVPRPSSRDEIGRLADTMNRMLDRLELARARERRFVADASHELRSPIAAIRQHAEVALAHPDAVPAAELARTAHAESLRMQALVDDLLLLAQADEQTLSVRRQPVDLDDLVLAEARRVRHEADHLRVDTSGVSAARIDGDPAALRRVLHNLGDNAARHARHRVAYALLDRDGFAELRVDDDGPGVPAADRSRVFDRFVRLDDARARTGGGSGLGLAIVAEIVAAHGGAVVIDDGPLGGARVTVRLPLAPD